MGKIINSKTTQAMLLQHFMHAYTAVSSKKRYDACVEIIQNADAIMVLGTKIATDSPELYKMLEVLSRKEDVKIVYSHPIDDPAMRAITNQFMKYEPGSEEGVIALLAYYLLEGENLPERTKNFLDALDVAYLEAESNTGEEEFEETVALFKAANTRVLILGDDLMAHPRAQNIAKICALIENNYDISIYIASSLVNEMEISQTSAVDAELQEVEDLPEYNGTVIYHAHGLHKDDKSLHGSVQFANAAKISDGDFISIAFDGQTINREFKIDNELKGTIAINPISDIDVQLQRYKFERSKINKINQNSESR
ncbi:MAG TPA: hypothetical protein EYG70_07465 [Sulfurimonas sp.]|nr:hypothetical protein [Sulfurimonas sp.]